MSGFVVFEKRSELVMHASRSAERELAVDLYRVCGVGLVVAGQSAASYSSSAAVALRPSRAHRAAFLELLTRVAMVRS